MRVEEMYLIEAEAAAQLSPAEGKTLLEDFVKTYRNPKYVCNASSKEEVVDECFLQKRIELFGEGLIFFDYKRLNKSVTRYYPGTNFAVARRYNTEGRPAWMNFVFVQQEASVMLLWLISTILILQVCIPHRLNNWICQT